MIDIASLKTPGVYISEISTLPSSIVAVETAIPAFIGYVEKMELDGKKWVIDANSPKYVRIESMKQYVDIFGGADAREAAFTVVVDKNTEGAITRIEMTKKPMPNYLMYYQMQMYFGNGGGPCYIIPVDAYETGSVVNKDKLRNTGLATLATIDEPTLIVFPDGVSAGSDLYGLYTDALAQCEHLQDRFVIMDLIKPTDTVSNAERLAFRNGIGVNNLKYGAAYYPWLKTDVGFQYDPAKVKVDVNTSVAAVAAIPASGTTPAVDAVPAKVVTTTSSLKDFVVEGKDIPEIYYKVKAKVNSATLDLPPSAAMAGLFAFVDSTRGVWKAPANVSVNKVLGLTMELNDDQQKEYNVSADTGKSINIIRSFSGRGFIVWGARTLDGNNNEWRYVNVRRFFIMVEESVKKAMNNYVFEPNDANTWVKVKSGIENFLTLQWRAGALQGAKPEQAFFVNIGLGTTMSAFDILEGRMIVQIGMAVVRPAEFIILEFMHKLAEA
jgi:uncharacterized protein